jgi:hypothetical protein
MARVTDWACLGIRKPGNEVPVPDPARCYYIVIVNRAAYLDSALTLHVYCMNGAWKWAAGRRVKCTIQYKYKEEGALDIKQPHLLLYFIRLIRERAQLRNINPVQI